ncbi:hypothetical protein GUITHDRAFT_147364 [Guillardia theta CCMP2712]|uniref:Uncharacterized protein n=1 Tax=Guillardia theta (strain CCMP2712) TaxID=905079 RepID=L1IEB9_GUITC|nr:hypothetical protein GUITHDRAFT_147364 [Guillardia theta CCMP2712]EKX34244.1 hypothetical protein GUITHDRAFT_147364 [Guillardia theta CCMP2712]|eukprot:XP_005821224.1 hypothetical protein GUITHDRAFT_147364 [Guillardia theta CCMP2712]
MRNHDHKEYNNQNTDNNNLHQYKKHNYLHQYNHDNHRLKTTSIFIDRIGLAGTSRMRGLYYSLLSVCNVSNGANLCRGAIDFVDRDVNIEYQSRRMEVSFMSEACNAALDYVFVTGSVWGEFSLEASGESFRCHAMITYLVKWLERNGYCRKPFSSHREILVLSIGFWESLENSFHLLQECGEHIFENLVHSCKDSSTFIIYKNEEATPSYSIPVLDAHSISLPRPDGTEDGIHYWYTAGKGEGMRRVKEKKSKRVWYERDCNKWEENAVTKSILNTLLHMIINKMKE